MSASHQQTSTESTPIVLFDGVCHLCDRTVQFVLDRDSAGVFRFAALQSSLGQRLLRQYDLPTDALDTMVLIHRGKAYTRSGAVLRMMRRLKFPWNLGAVFLIIPPPLRDLCYRFIAKRRYRWFGSRDECRLPDPTWKDRFLD